jgi:hypothetical protein
MLGLIIFYLVYLLIYAFISYAIAHNLIRYRVPGDKSQTILTIYIVLSIALIVGSLFFFVPVSTSGGGGL